MKPSEIQAKIKVSDASISVATGHQVATVAPSPAAIADVAASLSLAHNVHKVIVLVVSFYNFDRFRNF